MVKKTKRKRDNYFGPEHEKMVVVYNNCKDPEEKNKIFNEWFDRPFRIMTESLLRKYDLTPKLYNDEEVITSSLSHLVTKMHKYDPDSNYKAFSYYSVITRNYLVWFKKEADKAEKKYDDIQEKTPVLEGYDEMTYTLPDTDYGAEDILMDIVEEIRNELETNTKVKKKMNDNERKLGKALVKILGDWESVFGAMDGNNKFNKNNILHTIREYTGLNTKEIRIAMKRYKKLYGLLKVDKINDGFL